jgi:hypothetical protein
MPLRPTPGRPLAFVTGALATHRQRGGKGAEVAGRTFRQVVVVYGDRRVAPVSRTCQDACGARRDP